MEENRRPLCCWPTGAKVRVEDLCGGRGAKSRLYALGLTPGTVVEVVSGGDGPCRLRVRGSDLVLGHGLADKILVCPEGCDSCRLEDAEPASRKTDRSHVA